MQPTAKPKKRHVSNLKLDPAVQAAKRKAIIETLQSEPSLAGHKVAKLHHVHNSTVSRIKRALAAANTPASNLASSSNTLAIPPEDRGEKWGRLLSRYAPLKLRAQVLHKLLTSDNPVSAGRALEIVLESDGLRKKLTQPGTQASIIVSSNDDLGFS